MFLASLKEQAYVHDAKSDTCRKTVYLKDRTPLSGVLKVHPRYILPVGFQGIFTEAAQIRAY